MQGVIIKFHIKGYLSKYNGKIDKFRKILN